MKSEVENIKHRSKVMAIEKIIILEANAAVRSDLENYLRRGRFDVASTASPAAALEYLSKDNFDMLFLDLNLRDKDGTDLLAEIQTRPQRPLVVVTANMGSIESAVDCIRDGAFNYLVKPFSDKQIEVTLRKAEDVSQLVRVTRLLSRENDGQEHTLLGPDMEDVRQFVHKVACTNATVLIHGESGTGKEVIAHEIYRQSQRANAPFVRVNCAAIPENLLESEFFGHEKGAFTGALNKREGRFELAHGGTILLDEISEISLSMQAKLLRVLQEREFERVGGNRTIKVDVRVIATTNRNLEQSVERKEFRQDLYFRLNVVPVHVPPLRERPEDILALKKEFVRRFSRRHGIQTKGINDAATQMLLKHSWPGNVRELQNVIERAIILAGNNAVIGPEHLGLTHANLPAATSSAPKDATTLCRDQNLQSAFLCLADVEKNHILAALDKCDNNRTRAADLLGISIRTLRNKLHQYNGTSPSVRDADEESTADFHEPVAECAVA
jgi:DNA-binding NtrC family response regulator